ERSPTSVVTDASSATTSAVRPASTSSHPGEMRRSPAARDDALSASLGARSDLEWIDEVHPCVLEVVDVARRELYAVHQRARGDQTVLDRHGATTASQLREQLRPAQTRLRIPIETSNPLHTGREPTLELTTFAAGGEEQNPET